MNREKIAEMIRESVIDYDKELIIDAAEKLRSSVSDFYFQEINLKGKYPDLSFKYSGSFGFTFTFKDNSLVGRTDFEQSKIILKKVSGPKHVLQQIKERIIDEIIAKDHKLSCKDGDFNIEEVDEYLSKSIAEILK
ncbi:hypothetical protein [Halobacillus naozhouensis]|uniref:Immunity protein 44 n=1 Tax=Halobacillus naozhouensis TaxID=554880 RepID=A0ABY8J3T4_9BACI|nr:hypothetical protein [Halobacillus naozhouensis]WFT75611.1 hypothetical protein P9989_04255 [Halobacillus naozhouensis]